MTVIGRTEDRWGRPVALTEARWTHVITGHPELTAERTLILAAVSYPDLVMHDAEHDNRENFYRVIDWHPDGTPRRYLKVCVQYGPMDGTIITAFRCHQVKRGETQRWP